jgi:hypothetical protein
MDNDKMREWARREAAKLPLFTSAEVRRLGLLARRLDQAATR